MLIHVTRQQEQKRQFMKATPPIEYKLHCKAEFNEPEKALLHKYGGWNEQLHVIDPSFTMKKQVQGSTAVSIQTLASSGQEWKAELLYTAFTEIPEALRSSLESLFGQYHARENWGVGPEATETIEVPT